MLRLTRSRASRSCCIAVYGQTARWSFIAVIGLLSDVVVAVLVAVVAVMSGRLRNTAP